MAVRVLSIGSQLDPLNSNKLDKQCENVKKILLDDKLCVSLLRIAAILIFDSGIDLEKTRYKAESETDMMLNRLNAFTKEHGLLTYESLTKISSTNKLEFDTEKVEL
ncbi:hypothetical protein AZ002_003278 [Citrobacter freundii]|nr:hypothetical protein AZ002_003278 [Citrobacter freundii]